MPEARPLALVTGGRQGIGKGIALALAGAGFDVAITARKDDETSAAVVREVESHGVSALFLASDLADIESHEALLDAVEEWRGGIDCLVNNAGIPARRRGDLLEMTAESFDAVLGVNLRGSFFLTQRVARRMARSSGPRYRSLIFVSSVNAELVSVNRGEYCMSKSALSMMARLFAVRMAEHGVGAFEVRPGIIRTAMTAGVAEQYSEAIEGGLVPAGRWGTPEDIGAVVVPLARGQFAFATGSAIHADGGLSIKRL